MKTPSFILFACLSLSLAMSSTAQAQSLETLAAAAAAGRRDAAAQTAYGRALRQAGRFDEATRVLRAAARLQRGSLAALYEVAQVAFAENDYRKSRAACRALERESRTDGLTHVCRARAFLVWNRSGRAFEELEAAAAAGGAEFETQLALGDAHRLRASLSDAERAYQAAIAVDSARPEPHVGLGLLYAAALREADAVREFRAAAAIDADDPETNLALGKLVGGAEGRALVAHAIERQPNNANAQLVLADMAFAAGDLESAGEAYEAALVLEPRLAPALAGRGRVYLAQGSLDEATERLELAHSIVPADASVVLALGQVCERQERTQAAFTHYRHAADLNPADPSGLLAAGRLALAQGRDVLTTGFLDRLFQRHPDHAPALELYGDALAARRDRMGATRYYRRAIAAGADRAAVEQKIAGLQRRRGADSSRRAIAPGR